MRKFAEEYPDFKFVQEVLAQIKWYRNIILMDKVNDIEERKCYIKKLYKMVDLRIMLLNKEIGNFSLA